MAYALSSEGAKIKIFNIDLKVAEEMAGNFDAEYGSFEDLSEVSGFDIVLNSTPLGMGEYEDQTPISSEFLNSSQLVFDAVYKPYHTKLLKDAESVGARIVRGAEMLIYQGVEQFKIYTGLDAPEEVMADVVYKSLGVKELE